LYYRNNKGLGLADNWNMCAHLASGALLKYLHQDDFFARKESLGAFVNALTTDPYAGLVFCSSMHVDGMRKQVGFNKPNQDNIGELRNDYHILLGGNMIGAPSAVIYRHELHKDFEESLKWFIDIDHYMMLLRQNPSFVFIPEPLVCVRTELESRMTKQCSGNIKVELREAVFLWKKWIGTEYKDVSDTRYFSFLVERCLTDNEEIDLAETTADERELLIFLFRNAYVDQKRRLDTPPFRLATPSGRRNIIRRLRRLPAIEFLLPRGSKRSALLRKVVRGTLFGRKG